MDYAPLYLRDADTYILPGLIHVDHETMRSFQSLGCADQIAFDAVLSGSYAFFNKQGETLMKIDWSRPGICGWRSYNANQPETTQTFNGD